MASPTDSIPPRGDARALAQARAEAEAEAWTECVSLEVLHDYYGSARACPVDFAVTPDTRARLARAGGVARVDAGVWRLLMPHRSVVGLEPTAWVVALRSTDPDFHACTAGLPRPGEGIAVADSARAVPAPDGGVWRMPLQAASADGSAGRGPAAAGPVAAVTLRLGGPDAPPGRRYRLHFEARRVRWKYVLLGDWSGDDPRITDADEVVAFEPFGEEPVLGGRGLVSRTVQPLALARRPGHRFQLHARHDGIERVLVQALPQARTSGLALDAERASELVSEIHVLR